MSRWTWLLCAAAVAMMAAGPALAAGKKAPKKAPESQAPAQPAPAEKAPEAKAPEQPAAPEKAPDAAPATDEAKKPEAAPDAAPAAGEDKKPEAPALDPELALMAAECKFTDEQKAKLLETVTLARGQIDMWQKTNGEKMAGFQKAMMAAVEAQDQAAMEKVRAEAMPLIQERMALVAKVRDSILTIMTPEQQAVWQTYLLHQEVSGQLKPLNLTDDQAAKVKAICNATAKELSAIKGTDEAAQKANADIWSKMVTNIKESVLTAEQKKMLESPAQPPPGQAMPPAASPAPSGQAPAAPPAEPAKAPETAPGK